MPRAVLANHGAGERIERNQERGSAETRVVVDYGARSPLLRRQ